MARFDSVPTVRFDSGIRLDSGSGPSPAPPTKSNMSDPALKLASLTNNEVKTLAGALAAGLTANPLLVPTPKVTPAQLTAAVTAVNTQEVTLATAEANVTTQRMALAAAMAALEALMTASVTDSTLVVNHDTTKMTQLNIPLRVAPGTPAPAIVAGPPQNFSVTQGAQTGEAAGHCAVVANADLYRVQTATASGGPYTTAYEGKKSRFVIAGLTPGLAMWFQMAAFVNGHWTDWSDPATCRII